MWFQAVVCGMRFKREGEKWYSQKAVGLWMRFDSRGGVRRIGMGFRDSVAETVDVTGDAPVPRTMWQQLKHNQSVKTAEARRWCGHPGKVLELDGQPLMITPAFRKGPAETTIRAGDRVWVLRHQRRQTWVLDEAFGEGTVVLSPSWPISRYQPTRCSDATWVVAGLVFYSSAWYVKSLWWAIWVRILHPLKFGLL